MLLQHLAFLKQKGVYIWTDLEIETGEQWYEEIKSALWIARVAVLLVTPAFLDSSFIQKHELPPLLNAAKSEGLTIFWIPVEPSSYDHYEISNFQAAYSPNEPLYSLKGAKRNQALVEIASKLAKALGISK